MMYEDWVGLMCKVIRLVLIVGLFKLVCVWFVVLVWEDLVFKSFFFFVFCLKFLMLFYYFFSDCFVSFLVNV